MRHPKYNEDGSFTAEALQSLKNTKQQSVPNSNHRYGLVADPAGIVKKMQGHRKLFGPLKTGTSQSVSLSAGVAIRDQLITQACVGFAMATAIKSRLFKLGIKFDPSPLYTYSLGRMMDAEPEELLIDSGSMPHAAVEGLQTYGLVSEGDWPFELANVNQEVPWDIQHKSSAFIVRGIYKVEEEGVAIGESIRESLWRGHPVFFGTYMTDAVENYTGGVLEPDGVAGPGHAMCIVGYDDGGDVFEVSNSWGDSWGDGGYLWVHRRFVEHALSGHRYVVSVEAM